MIKELLTTVSWSPQTLGWSDQRGAEETAPPPPASAAGTASPTSRTGNAGWPARSDHTTTTTTTPSTHTTNMHPIIRKITLTWSNAESLKLFIWISIFLLEQHFYSSRSKPMINGNGIKQHTLFLHLAHMLFRWKMFKRLLLIIMTPF